MDPTRPLIRYHGGKWLLAPWILSFFPEHRIYIESFGGGANLLLRKKRAYCEIYNELDGEIVNLFKVVRDRGEELVRKLWATPFSRIEFSEAWLPDNDPIEQARRTVIRSFMGFGSAATTMGRNVRARSGTRIQFTGFRSTSHKGGNTPAADWANYPEALRLVIERMRGVVIEQRPAMAVAKKYDDPKALHYLDPPYMKCTRDEGDDYTHEMDESDHEEMLKSALNFVGYVIISGYNSDMYNDILMPAGWKKFSKKTHADSALSRTEYIWLSPNIKIVKTLFNSIET